jgi:hypothetical protein
MSKTAKRPDLSTIDAELAAKHARAGELQASIDAATHSADDSAPVREWSRELRELKMEIADIEVDRERFASVEQAKDRRERRDLFKKLQRDDEDQRVSASELGRMMLVHVEGLTTAFTKLDALYQDNISTKNAMSEAATTGEMDRRLVPRDDIYGATGLSPRYLKELRIVAKQIEKTSYSKVA